MVKTLLIQGNISHYASIKSIRKDGKSEEFLAYANSYNVEYRQQMGRKFKMLYYKPIAFSKNGVIIPRFISCSILGNVLPHPFREHIPIDYSFTTELWNDKQVIIDAVIREIRETGGATLQLDTGKGKTVIIANTIFLLRAKTVIFAANKTLQIQLRDEIATCLGTEDIGLVGNGVKYSDFSEHPIWIIITDSARKIPYQDFSVFDYTVFDECHKFCSPKNFSLMRECSTRWVLALSATVTKTWDYTKILHNCGPFVDGDALSLCDKKIPGIVRIIKYIGPPEYTRKLKNASGDMCCAYMSEQFSRDPYRNNLIITELHKLLADGHNVMVISNTNDIIIKLHNLADIDYSGILNADTKPGEKERVIHEAPVIFTNYASSSEGVNIPRITAMIFLTSFVNNGKQISGRALRGGSNDKKRVFVDIVDTHLGGQLPSRMETWTDRGFEIEIVDAHFLNFATILSPYIT